jgi:hypothetical protein
MESIPVYWWVGTGKRVGILENPILTIKAPLGVRPKVLPVGLVSVDCACSKVDCELHCRHRIAEKLSGVGKCFLTKSLKFFIDNFLART